jgi:thymidylate synthase
MYSTTVTNLQQAFFEALREVMTNGDTVTVREQETREIQTMVMQITNPAQRVICMPYRNNNIFATIAETLWVLAGRNDIAFLSKYLPRAKDFSDDGLVWRAGYGKRLREFEYKIDQVKENIDLLNEDNTTRRAVMTIFDPVEDFVRDTVDTPCSNWIHTMIRHDKVNTTVAVRSNDVIWGMSGINLFEWSVLMELIASSTDNKVGELHYLADSCHVYSRHYERANKIIDNVIQHGLLSMYEMGFGSTPITSRINGDFDDFDNQLRFLLEAIDTNTLNATIVNELEDTFLVECGWMLVLHKLLNADKGVIDKVLTQMTHGGDFRAAALEYLHRQDNWKDLENFIDISKTEREFLEQFPHG